MAEFKPIPDATTTIDALTTSANAAVRTNADPNQPVRVWNAGVSVVFIKAGTSSVTASTNNMPIPPNTVGPEIIALGPADTHIAAYASVSCKLYLTPGSIVRG